MVLFCSCGGLLVPQPDGGSVCRSCHKRTSAVVAVESQKTKRATKNIAVIEDNAPAHPVTDNICKQCGNDHAYYQVMQTRSSDEPPTRIYKCTKCGFTWREYS